MTDLPRKLDIIVERFLETGEWDATNVAALDDDELAELLERLGDRAAIDAAAMGLPDPSPAADGETHDIILSLQSFYLGEIARVQSAKADPLSVLAKPATWLKIEPVLRDRDFLIRLAQRRLRGLGDRCIRDLADLLGKPLDALATYLRGPAGEGLALAENKNAGKPSDDGTEAFADALARSQLPEIFKSRWKED
jgi:hypothetical protein